MSPAKQRVLVAGLLVLCLSSCVAPVESDVTRFHALPEKGSGQTVTVENIKGGSMSDLERAALEERVAKHLVAYGWRRVAVGSRPDYKVAFTYGMDDGRQVSGAVPIIGQTGGGTTFSSGTVSAFGGTGSYSGTSYQTPTYGVIGSRSYSHTVFGRFLLLRIYDKQMKEVFSAKVISSGSNGVDRVLPQLIDAAFDKFPGVSGKTRHVSKRLD